MHGEIPNDTSNSNELNADRCAYRHELGAVCGETKDWHNAPWTHAFEPALREVTKRNPAWIPDESKRVDDIVNEVNAACDPRNATEATFSDGSDA